MSQISANPQTDSHYVADKQDAKRRFLDRLSKMGRVFWQYTEETGESSTKSYEGLL